MTTAVRSQIIFEALAMVNPDAANGISAKFNGQPAVAAALGMAELKRSLGFDKSFGPKARCA